MLIAIVTFSGSLARDEFWGAWAARTGGPSCDESDSLRVELAGDNAERALDLANEIVGVSVESFDDEVDGNGVILPEDMNTGEKSR